MTARRGGPQAHPIAALFPLDEAGLPDLAEDIKQRGQLQPIVVDEDEHGEWILDGRRRFAACELAGVEPWIESYEGEDPAGYALAVNIQRRQMTKGQIAMVVARATCIGSLQSTREVAVIVGVSHTRISQARIVLEHAPDLADGVVTGAVKLDGAVDEARRRKAAAASVEARLTRLRSEAPDLAELVAEDSLTLDEAFAAHRERQEQDAASIRRTVDRVERFVEGWPSFTEVVLDPDHPHHLSVMDALSDVDLDHLERIRKEIDR